MRRALSLFAFVSLSLNAWCAPLSKIQISIINPTTQARSPEDIVLRIADLRQIAPNLNPACLIVTDDQGVELPSQIDDLDGDNKADELAFQINLKPRETRTVTISYGDPDSVYRVRSVYPKRTGALFATKIEGLGWESGQNAWRLYFDPRNAIDLYGKRRESPFLDILATPEYNYHADTINGRDIYKVGDALGIGAVGAWVDGKSVRVSDVSARNWRVTSAGPVRSIVEITYESWKVGGKTVNLRSRITQWAGDRGFFHAVAAEGDAITLVTGLPLKPAVSVARSDTASPNTWLATYGEQVVQPGPTATEELQGTNLGLVVILLGAASAQQDALNYLVSFSSQAGRASWYVAAAWDQEGMNNKLVLGKSCACGEPSAPTPLTAKAAFLSWVEERSAQLASPAVVKIATMP